MKLDTLFLSGGGINCIALLGVFKYLFENNIIQRDFTSPTRSVFYLLNPKVATHFT